MPAGALAEETGTTLEQAKLTMVDAGGSLLFRAQGAPKGKDFGVIPHEWDTLRVEAKAPYAAKVFASMTVNLPKRCVDLTSYLRPNR